MNKGKVSWAGSYVAVVHAVHGGGRIDERPSEANIEFLVGNGADGIVVSGCTGESWSLTRRSACACSSWPSTPWASGCP